jgi:hypothetical protein
MVNGEETLIGRTLNWLVPYEKMASSKNEDEEEPDGLIEK